MKSNIQYIRTGGEVYYYQKKGVQDPEYRKGVFIRYCIITKLKKGRYKIEYEDYFRKRNVMIVYPSGIEQIKFNTR